MFDTGFKDEQQIGFDMGYACEIGTGDMDHTSEAGFSPQHQGKEGPAA